MRDVVPQKIEGTLAKFTLFELTKFLLKFSDFHLLPWPVIHHFFTLCLNQGLLPMEWMNNKIIRIFKSGERWSVKHYKPIFCYVAVQKC